MKEVNSRLKPSAGGIAFSACTAANVVVALVLALVLNAAHVQESSDVYKYLSYLAAPAAIALGCLFTLKFCKQPLRASVGIKCSPVYFAIALLMGFGLIFCVSGVNDVTLEFLKLIGYTPRGESSYLPNLDGGYVVPALLVIAVVPAAAEEILFRGVILGNAREGMGDALAVLSVGLCFSLFHASPEQTVYQFICGCAFALLTVRSGSVLPAVLIHFLNNALIIILYALGYSSMPFSRGAGIAVLALGGAAFAASVIWLLLTKKPFKKRTKGGALSFYACAFAGIAVNAVIWILSFFGF